MSVSLWAWTESCDNERCCGECDLCRHRPEDEEIEHIEAEVVEGTKDPEPEPQPQTVNQSVNNPVVINITMNQSGNGRQYGYIADYHEKGED